MIKDNRNKIREIKNELKPMKLLKDSFINKSMNNLKNAQAKLDREIEILSKLSESVIYNPRTQEVNGEIVTTRKTLKEKRMIQKELKNKFIHNANYKTSGLKVCILSEVNERQFDCIILDNQDTYHRVIVNKTNLVNLNENKSSQNK